MMYDAVLFDVDGTLLDTSEGIVISVKDTIEHLGLPVLSYEEMLKFIGPPIEVSFESKCGLTGDKLKEAAAYFRARYAGANLLRAKVYDNMYDFLDFLRGKGIGIGIATYKRHSYATTLLNHFRFNEYTDVIYGSDDEGKLKKSDIIQLCLDKLGVTDPKRVLMVGDTNHDATGAQAIGTDFAGVSFGFGFGQFGGQDINDYEHVIYVDNVMEMTKLWQEA